MRAKGLNMHNAELQQRYKLAYCSFQNRWHSIQWFLYRATSYASASAVLAVVG